jgi:cytoskeletal protein CcmA (bactofilin family)
MSLVSSFGILAVAATIVIGAPRLLRRSTSAGILLSFFVIFLTCSLPAFAIDHRSGGSGADQGSIVVAAGETVDDTLIATGNTVTVEGTVNGDVIAAGRSVEVRGAIHGNLIAFAQNVIVEGAVDGTTFAFAQNVRVRGEVVRDLYGFAQSVALEPNGKIGRNLVSFAQVLTADGEAGRDVIAFVQRLEARGSIARDLSVHAEQVSLLAPAHVERDFVAELPRESNFKLESGASIGGKRNIRIVPPEPSEYATVWFYIRQILWLIAAFITGLVLFWLFPALSRPRLEHRSELLESGVFGFLATVATPIAAIIIGITIIGLPIALASLALWVFGLYIAKIVVAAYVGRSLFGTPTTSLAIQLLAGLVIVLIAVDIPYVGGLVNFLLTIVGLGAILLEVFKRRPKTTESPALP